MKYFALLLILLSACKIDSDKAVDREKFTFKTGHDTALFFKNMRQSFYDMEVNKAAKFDVFRYEDRLVTDDQPVLNLAIVINYLHDEAYLLIEPNKLLENENELKVRWTINESENGLIVLQTPNRESMLEFASQIYEMLQRKATFEIGVNGEYVPVLDSEEEREAFRVTMSDYYRLIRVY